MAGRKKQTPVANAAQAGRNSGSHRPRKTSTRTNLKREDKPTQLNAPAKRASKWEGAEIPSLKRQKITDTKRSLESNFRGVKGAPTRRDKVTIRCEQDERCQGRVWLYKTEAVDYYRYNLACSDLLALPAYVTANEYGQLCQCFRVFHLDWLQGQINAGKGINLPAGSAVDEDKPQFVLENGESICRKEIKMRYGSGLIPKQLKRIKPCKKDRPVGGVRDVEHWNVCDIEALLQQGQNLKSVCPPAPKIQRSTMEYDYDDLLEVAEERDCPCCIWMGLPL